MNRFIIRLILAIIILGIGLMLIPKARPMSLPSTGKGVPMDFIQIEGHVKTGTINHNAIKVEKML